VLLQRYGVSFAPGHFAAQSLLLLLLGAQGRRLLTGLCYNSKAI
jgi:hypothetical protein